MSRVKLKSLLSGLTEYTDASKTAAQLHPISTRSLPVEDIEIISKLTYAHNIRYDDELLINMNIIMFPAPSYLQNAELGAQAELKLYTDILADRAKGVFLYKYYGECPDLVYLGIFLWVGLDDPTVDWLGWMEQVGGSS